MAEKHIDAQILKASVQMTIEELLEGKSPEFKDGFNQAMQIASDYTRELLNIYFGMKLSDKNSKFFLFN